MFSQFCSENVSRGKRTDCHYRVTSRSYRCIVPSNFSFWKCFKNVCSPRTDSIDISVVLVRPDDENETITPWDDISCGREDSSAGQTIMRFREWSFTTTSMVLDFSDGNGVQLYEVNALKTRRLLLCALWEWVTACLRLARTFDYSINAKSGLLRIARGFFPVFTGVIFTTFCLQKSRGIERFTFHESN